MGVRVPVLSPRDVLNQLMDEEGLWERAKALEL